MRARDDVGRSPAYVALRNTYARQNWPDAVEALDGVQAASRTGDWATYQKAYERYFTVVNGSLVPEVWQKVHELDRKAWWATIRRMRRETRRVRRAYLADEHDVHRMKAHPRGGLTFRLSPVAATATSARAPRRVACSSGRPGARRAVASSTRAGPDDPDPPRPWPWQPRPTIYPCGPRCDACLELLMWQAGQLVCANAKCPESVL